MTELIKYYNEDCMVGMARYPDKHFDLAIVDPPYGIGIGRKDLGLRKTEKRRHKLKSWDVQAPPEYFKELFRVSKNQIVWGGNYFKLPVSRGWIFWDKVTPVGLTFSDGELAWTSLDTLTKKFTYNYMGAKGVDSDGRIHPTQKPVALYKWLLTNYAKEGDLILDTHVGSASSLIACHELGFDAVGFELDEDYYKASLARLQAVQKQVTFDELIKEDK